VGVRHCGGHNTTIVKTGERENIASARTFLQTLIPELVPLATGNYARPKPRNGTWPSFTLLPCLGYFPPSDTPWVLQKTKSVTQGLPKRSLTQQKQSNSPRRQRACLPMQRAKKRIPMRDSLNRRDAVGRFCPLPQAPPSRTVPPLRVQFTLG
jgi:hypothetical protein